MKEKKDIEIRTKMSIVINTIPLGYHLTLDRMAIIKKLQIINAGEGVEKRKPSYTVGGNVNWYSHFGEQDGGFLKN